MRKHRYAIFCSMAGVWTALALYVASQSPAVGYEYSIYTSTPLTFWVLVICSITICIALLVQEASKGNVGNRWLFALGVLMFNGMAVLLLSVFRNYYTVGTDTLMHIGYVKDLSNGIISAQNVYPAVHVVPALMVLAGVSPALAVNLSPVVWYAVYVSSFYGLARMVWADRRMVIIAMTLAVALLLPMGVGLVATLVGVAVFPLTLLVLLKLRQEFKVKYLVFLAVLMAVISLLHPLALETTMIALVLLCLVSARNRWKLVAVTAVVLPLAVWWYWYWVDINLFGAFFKDLFRSTVLPAVLPSGIPASGALPPLAPTTEELNGFSWLPSMAGIQATQTVGEFNTLSLILRRYGSEILLGCLAFVSLVVAIRKLCRDFWLAYFGSLFVVFNIMWLMGWYLELKAYDLALSRMLNWVPIVSILLATPLLVRLLGSRSLRKLSVSVVVLILLVVSNSALFHLYSSPIVGVPNAQVTHQQVKGISWLLKNGTPEVPIVHLNSQRVSRFVAAQYGVEWVRNHQTLYWLHEYTLPKEFDYDDNLSLGWKYPKDYYLVVTKCDKSLPSWESDRLYLIEGDPATTLFYRDGEEFEVWFVESYQKGKK